MRVEKVGFPNSHGERLDGRLHHPAGTRRGVALFAHCFTCSAASRAAVAIAAALAEEGYVVLRFDFTGLGESDGEFAGTTFSSNVADLVAAADFLAREHESPGLLVGHSLGGAAVLAAAPAIDSCRAVVTIGAPATAAHVEQWLGDAQGTREGEGQARVELGGRAFNLGQEFIADLRAQQLPESVRGLRRALLIMHAPLDDIVGIDNAGALFQHALHPKSFVSLDQADHLLTRSEDSTYAARVLAAWATRYLPPVERAERAAATGGVRASTPATGFATEVVADGHRLRADEPLEAGGTGTGPSPYDLLAAALASCTSMTLQMYARRKSLPLEEAIVQVRHSKIHAADCAECDTQEGRIDEFVREIELRGSLEPAARQRLLEIADRCPVHRTLTREVSIRTRAQDTD